ncbi:hypothetical protein [Corallococcus terminator]|uniref:Uncharacterized protein n=1 Tax=Corallococcus terminator TaxID=2316733 RepID=A0A3A8IS06_9BACT|nr:hypothetical protein [Corallococcus terminator]RKG81091.1 hypothetical protein D7V88_26695 [Corallococcus terminator]
MIRSDKRRGRVIGVLMLGCTMVWGTGCKKEQAVAPVAIDAGMAAVAVRDAGSQDVGMVARVKKPLRFSDVKLATNRYRVDVTYTLTNPGTAQGRGDACLSLHDDQGLVIHQAKLGGITVKGGTSDTFEDRVDVNEAFWKQTRTVLLYTAEAYDCSSGVSKMTSERFQLLPTGQPAPAGTPAPQAPGSSTAADFAVSNIQVSQEGSSDNYSATYVVKNLSTRRVSGRGCLRAYVAAGDRFLEEVRVGDFSLRPSGSETITDTIIFEDDKHWDEVKVLRLFISPYGCADEVDAENAGITFDKPAGIHAPVEGVDADGEVELDPDNNDAVVDVPDEAQDPVDDHGGDEPYSDAPEDTGH